MAAKRKDPRGLDGAFPYWPRLTLDGEIVGVKKVSCRPTPTSGRFPSVWPYGWCISAPGKRELQDNRKFFPLFLLSHSQ
jgi:hypothetical protein